MQKVEIECRELKVEIKLIDRKVAKARRNKVADRGETNNILIQSLEENAKDKNTQQSTKN